MLKQYTFKTAVTAMQDQSTWNGQKLPDTPSVTGRPKSTSSFPEPEVHALGFFVHHTDRWALDLLKKVKDCGMASALQHCIVHGQTGRSFRFYAEGLMGEPQQGDFPLRVIFEPHASAANFKDVGVQDEETIKKIESDIRSKLIPILESEGVLKEGVTPLCKTETPKAEEKPAAELPKKVEKQVGLGSLEPETPKEETSEPKDKEDKADSDVIVEPFTPKQAQVIDLDEVHDPVWWQDSQEPPNGPVGTCEEAIKAAEEEEKKPPLRRQRTKGSETTSSSSTLKLPAGTESLGFVASDDQVKAAKKPKAKSKAKAEPSGHSARGRGRKGRGRGRGEGGKENETADQEEGEVDNGLEDEDADDGGRIVVPKAKAKAKAKAARRKKAEVGEEKEADKKNDEKEEDEQKKPKDEVTKKRKRRAKANKNADEKEGGTEKEVEGPKKRTRKPAIAFQRPDLWKDLPAPSDEIEDASGDEKPKVPKIEESKESKDSKEPPKKRKSKTPKAEEGAEKKAKVDDKEQAARKAMRSRKCCAYNKAYKEHASEGEEIARMKAKQATCRNKSNVHFHMF